MENNKHSNLSTCMTKSRGTSSVSLRALPTLVLSSWLVEASTVEGTTVVTSVAVIVVESVSDLIRCGLYGRLYLRLTSAPLVHRVWQISSKPLLMASESGASPDFAGIDTAALNVICQHNLTAPVLKVVSIPVHYESSYNLREIIFDCHEEGSSPFIIQWVQLCGFSSEELSHCSIEQVSVCVRVCKRWVIGNNERTPTLVPFPTYL